MRWTIQSIRELPPKYKGTPRPAIAVAGRSNVGKSSLINKLLGRKIAATSKQPGRTRKVHRFLVNERFDLVDLPGYGYAKINMEVRQSWRAKVTDFLSGHGNLRRLLILVDIRRGMGPLDKEMLEWAELEGVDPSIILTKADKLSKNQRIKTVNAIRKEFGSELDIRTVSSLKGDGITDLFEQLYDWWGEDSFSRD